MTAPTPFVPSEVERRTWRRCLDFARHERMWVSVQEGRVTHGARPQRRCSPFTRRIVRELARMTMLSVVITPPRL